MRIGSCLFLAGILTLFQFRELPDLYPVALLLLIFILSAWMKAGLRLFIWYIGGFFWALLASHHILSKSLPADLEWRDITVRGYVASLPVFRDRYVGFNLDITEVIDERGNHRPSPGKVRLNWYRPFTAILPGEKLDLTVKLKRPHGFMNPGGFDYEAWLFQQRIRATGYVRKDNNPGASAGRRFSVDLLRHRLRQKLESVLAGSASAGLVQALVLGDRSLMNNTHWQVLTTTGTSHLLAISGLHIGLVAGFAYMLTRRTWPISSRAVNWMPATRAAAVASLLAAIVYALLAGFTIPTRRALIMIGVIIIFGFLYRRIASADVLVLAMLAVLVIDPTAALSTGFWLSFSAVFIIFFSLAGTGHDKTLYLFRRWWKVQIYIFVGLIPVLGFWFNQIPLGSLPANSIAIPWVSFVSVPLIITGTVLLMIHETVGAVILKLGATSLDLLWPYLESLAGMDSLLYMLPQPSGFGLVMALAGIAMTLMPAGMPGKLLGVICLLPLLFPKPGIAFAGGTEFTVLDTGQGLAAVVRTGNHLLLYDTGPGFSSGFNAGDAVILPYLKSRGEGIIDVVVISHGDNDHIGGLQAVLQNSMVGKVISSVPEDINFTRVQRCIAGQRWIWDGVRFEILHPEKQSTLGKNDRSCVLKVTHGRYSVLLPGDIERHGERELTEKRFDSLAADILVAPHHGSGTSSSHTFLRAVAPEYVIIPAGYLNRFRLPKQDIIDRYRGYGAKILVTARDGAVTVRFGRGGPVIVKEREKSLRFWNNRP